MFGAFLLFGFAFILSVFATFDVFSWQSIVLMFFSGFFFFLFGWVILLPDKKETEVPELQLSESELRQKFRGYFSPTKPFVRYPRSARCRKHLPALLIEQGYRCNNQYCNKELWLSIAEADHIFAKVRAKAAGWSIEKTDDKSNLQALCKPCNRSKGTKLWGVFLEEERIKCHFAGAGNMVYAS